MLLNSVVSDDIDFNEHVFMFVCIIIKSRNCLVIFGYISFSIIVCAKRFIKDGDRECNIFPNVKNRAYVDNILLPVERL